MSTKQNEKTSQIITLFFSVISLVFVVLDICNVWKYADLAWGISFGLFLAFEAKISWNKNRKLAVTDLVVGIVLIVVKILTTIL